MVKRTFELCGNVKHAIFLKWGKALKEKCYESVDIVDGSMLYVLLCKELLDLRMLISPAGSIAYQETVNALKPFIGMASRFERNLKFDGTQPASSGLAVGAMEFGIHGER